MLFRAFPFTKTQWNWVNIAQINFLLKREFITACPHRIYIFRFPNHPRQRAFLKVENDENLPRLGRRSHLEEEKPRVGLQNLALFRDPVGRGSWIPMRKGHEE